MDDEHDEALNDGEDAVAPEESAPVVAPGQKSSFASKISIDALCSYVPASIIRFLQENASSDKSHMVAPFRHSYETVVLFADVSGFTDLSERLAMKGREGSEQLAKHLNSYFEQLVRVIASQGGDVFKFAGDALLVLWPPSDDDLCTVTRRAVQSALEIQRKMHSAKLQEDVVLSVKLGIGVGTCSIVHVGGVLSRMEYLATGSPLIQAFASEHKAVAGQVVCSPEAWHIIKDHFAAQIIPSGHAFIDRCSDRLRKVGIVKTANLDIINDVHLIESISNYVPGAVLPFLNASEERWASELRHVAVIFANLGFTEAQLAKIASEETTNDLDRVQSVIFSVQTAIYQYEGSVNKFLLDDKGSTLLAVFGLPPVAHEDDSARAILASLVICNQLSKLGVVPAIGITTGTAFCGVVGSRSRREYSVLGDVVNLSARLMQYAKTQGGGVLVDHTTQYSARDCIAFEGLTSIMVKGKKDFVKVFSPIASSVAPHGIWNQHRNDKASTVARAATIVHSQHNPHAELSRTLAGGSTTPLSPATTSPTSTVPVDCTSMTLPQIPSLSNLWEKFPPRDAGEVSTITVERTINTGDWGPPKSDDSLRLGSSGAADVDVGASMTPAGGVTAPVDTSSGLPSSDPTAVSVGRGAGNVHRGGPGDDPPAPTVDDAAWLEHTKTWIEDDDDMHFEAPTPIFPAAVPASPQTPMSESEMWSRTMDRVAANAPLLSVLPQSRLNTSSFSSQRTLGSSSENASQDESTSPWEDGASSDYRLRSSDSHPPAPQFAADAPHPYKTARFQLQDRGYITLDVTRLQTVLQVKERLFESLHRKHFVAPNANMDQYALHIGDRNALLQNENVTLALLPRVISNMPGPMLDIVLTRKADFDEHLPGQDGVSAADVGMAISKAMQSLIRTRDRATIILEGEAGYGKSRLLSQVVREAPAYVLFRAANPLESKTPLGIWREFFMRLIDMEIANKSFDHPAEPVLMRKCFVMKSLASLPGYSAIAGVLNEVLPLELDETEVTASMPFLERLSNCIVIMLALLRVFVKRIGSTIIIIDDALLMDKLSWGFALRVSCDFTNVLLILGTRPVNKSNLGAFDLEVPMDYLELLSQKTTSRYVLRALTNEEIYNIGVETLGVSKLPNTLAIILLQRSHGNPLVCKELLYSLRKNELIEIRTEKSGKVCTLSDKFTDLSIVPVPICLQNILGCRIDRLGHIHEIALKVASVIGTEFQMDLLMKTYPILEHVPSLPDVIADLCQLNVFCATHVSADANPSQNVYRFVDGFMRDVALSRLIVSQKQLLMARINEAKTRNTRLTKPTDFQVQGSVKFSGFLHIRKALDASNVSSTMRMRMGTWKKRWVVLHENSVSLYYHPTHPRVLGVIFLDSASVSMLTDSSIGRDYTIQIQAQYWMKKGVTHDSKRLFYMAAATLEDARVWSYKIAVTIEKQLSVRERHAIQASLASDSQRDTTDLWTPEFSRGPPSQASSVSADASSQSPLVRMTSHSVLFNERSTMERTASSSSTPLLPPGDGSTAAHTFRSSLANSVQYLSRRLKSSSSGSMSRRSMSAMKMNGRVNSADMDRSVSVNSSISEVGQQRVPWRPTLDLDLLPLASDLKSAVKAWLYQGGSFVTTDDNKGDDGLLRPILSDSAINKSGIMEVLDHQLTVPPGEDPRWRRRWLALTSDSLVITASQFDDDVMFALSISRIRHQKATERLTFHVESDLALDGPTLLFGKPTAFSLRAENDATFASWYDQISQMIDEAVLMSETSRSAIALDNSDHAGTALCDVEDRFADYQVYESNLFADAASQILRRLNAEVGADNANASWPAIRRELDALQKLIDTCRKVDPSSAQAQARLSLGVSKLDSGSSIEPETSLSATLQNADAANSTMGSVTTTTADPEMYRDGGWLIKMMDECDIDDSTKMWLARCYTLDGQEQQQRLAYAVGGDQAMPSQGNVSETSSICINETDMSSEDDNMSYDYRPSIGGGDGGDTPRRWALGRSVSFAEDAVSSETLFQWDFDIFSYEKSQLSGVIARLFEGMDFVNTFHVDPKALSSFVSTVSESYLDNPYHNLFHSVDTSQTVCCLLKTFHANAYLTSLEMFALLIAAACHDVGHPGLSNTYQVNASTKLALLYNDQSVLEHHHCAMTFHILKRPGCNILSGLTEPEYRSARKIIISSILSTDMTCHFSLSEKFSNLLLRRSEDSARSGGRAGRDTISPSTSPHASILSPTALCPSDRETVANMLLHSADISNQCKSWPVAKRWSDCILIELFHQGDVERESNLALSPNCDRHTTDRLQFTLNFIDFVVAPLFVSLTHLLPACVVTCNSLRYNRLRWDAVLLQNIAQSNMSPEKKREEELRWRRRMASFDEILMFEVAPPDKPDASKARKSSMQLFESFVKANSSSGALLASTRARSSSPPIKESALERTVMHPILETKHHYRSKSGSYSLVESDTTTTGDAPDASPLMTSGCYPPADLGPPPEPPSTGLPAGDSSSSLDDLMLSSMPIAVDANPRPALGLRTSAESGIGTPRTMTTPASVAGRTPASSDKSTPSSMPSSSASSANRTRMRSSFLGLARFWERSSAAKSSTDSGRT
ncbi:Phosphodiesterase [Plasmodiophora brassicae]|uniref:Phosphodiesterase n=1 Tax=Plasmodiophora brassicae TaxID=37360 RepID=A0A0G4IWG7_PLABS|nr:hypothetical protein PBRA_007232 [Plasmodiophora brassicae]